ncbi:MAG: methyltransferase domain-containing protein [Elusimicrobiales bacterium]|nr:methyltransferase domain-containing protein [Elusimicrobiales bacterium]
MIKKLAAWFDVERNFLFFWLGLAALLRLAWVLKTGTGGLSPDAYDWLNTAWRIASGEGFGGSWRPPGYAFYLAGVFAVFGKSVMAAKLLNVLLGTATVLLAYLAAGRLFDGRTARITAALMSFYPYFIAYTGDLLSETFLTFILSAAVYALARAGERASLPNLAAAGVVMGFTALTKSTTLPFLLLACGWLWWQSGKLKAALLAGLFTALAIMPWTLRNYLHHDGYVMPVSTPWYTFYGSCSDAAVRVEMMGEQDSPQIAQISPKDWDYVTNLPLPERDKYCREKSLEWLRENPDTFSYLLYLRALHFWRLYPMMAYKWQKYAAMATSGLYIPLCFLGILLSLGALRKTSLLIGLLLLYTLVHMLFVVTLRYRVPVDPYIIMFAAYALARLSALRLGPAARRAPSPGGDFARQEQIREFYDSTDYFTSEKNFGEIGSPDTPFQRYRISKILGIYDPGPGEAVLDLGCGWGTMEKVLHSRVREITGVDYSAKSIELCERAFKGLAAPNVKFVRADASATGLDSAAYDTVFCADLVEHLYPEVFEKMLAECRRLLKPGGRLVIWTDCRDSLLTILRENDIFLAKDVAHVDYKTLEGLKASLAAAGFTTEKAYYAESHIPVFSLLEKALLPYCPLARRRIAVLARKPAGA